MSSSPTTTTPAARRQRRIFRKRNVLLLLLFLVAGAICFPPSFQLLLRKSLEFEISRQGVHGTIDEVRGSLFTPVVLRGVKLEDDAAAIRRAHLTIDRLTATFSPRSLIRRHANRWLHKIHLDGVSLEFDFGAESNQMPPELMLSKSWPPSLFQLFPNLTPGIVEVENAGVVLRVNESVITASGIRFAFKENQPGALKIAYASIDLPLVKKRYSNLSAAIGAQGSNLVLGEMTIEQNLRIESVSVDLWQLAAKRVELNYNMDAFGGSLGGDIKSARNAEKMNIEATGTFKNISVADLGDFLGTKSKTAGLLEEGKISFRGLIQHPESGNATLRIRATDFQWGKRKWNLLVAGMSLLNGEVRMHQLELMQAGNELTASGEINLPERGTAWWRQNFELHLTAQINDLAQLSALLGPEAEKATGKIDIDGSIRGSDSKFHGQIIATGSNVSYRGVPFDSLTVAARIRGNEVQLRHMELIHGNDFVRGSGVVNILGIRHYWGELKASIADLTDYAPLLVPPVAPTPFGGALIVEWSGDGNVKAHSGAFHARFSDLVPLQVRENSTPINGNLEATYSPGHIFFSTFELGSNTTKLDTRVIIRPDSVELKDLKLAHKKTQRLSGELLLPVNAWAAWAGGNLNEVLNGSGKCEGRLEASKMPVGEALQLTGKTIPVSGELSGKVALSGSINELKASGELLLARGGMTFGDDKGLSMLNVRAALDGNQIVITEMTGGVFGGSISGNGALRLSNLSDPELDLKLKAQGLNLSLEDSKITVNLDSNWKGRLNSCEVTGNATLIAVSPSAGQPEFFSLLKALTPEIENPFSIKRNPFDKWRLGIRCRQEKAVSMGKAWIRPDLRIEGSAETPQINGILEFGDIPVQFKNEMRVAESATVFYDANHFTSPVIAVLNATVKGESATAAGIVGTLAQPRLATSPAIAMKNLDDEVPAKHPIPALRQIRFDLIATNGSHSEMPFLEARNLGIRPSTIPDTKLQ